MEIKNSKNRLVFSYESKTTLKNMMQAIGNKPDELMQALQKQAINPTGPQIWVYEGSNGNPDAEFNLKITIPVEKKGADIDKMKFEELPPYKYVDTTHNGPYNEFSKVYQDIMGNVMKAGLIPDGSSREIYINCDFEDQSKCVTEIQIGIK